ncbi:hypothetical protein NDU88_001259 [Pleurodeles waltl]|uniref:Uncharacterized protein n=1 Tax=Pleurodeles waltl TaxID=8319 RepID=A0AAV7TJ68_PLEWA|nr:hypothetical protein NDU88_001259 [Pleurodeles waltl]
MAVAVNHAHSQRILKMVLRARCPAAERYMRIALRGVSPSSKHLATASPNPAHSWRRHKCSSTPPSSRNLLQCLWSGENKGTGSARGRGCAGTVAARAELGLPVSTGAGTRGCARALGAGCLHPLSLPGALAVRTE